MNWKLFFILFVLILLISTGIYFTLYNYSDEISDYQDDLDSYYSNLIEDDSEVQKNKNGETRELDPISTDQIYNKGVESSVIVEARFGHTVNDGSGFIISDNYIVTAAHVVEDSEDIEVEYNDGSTSSANLIDKNMVIDVALLETDEKIPVEPIELETSEILLDNNAILIGNPGGRGIEYEKGPILDSGEVIEYNGVNAPEHFSIEVDIERGYSGGPILNQEGNVIGLSRGKGNGNAFGVSGRMIDTFVQTVEEEGEYIHKKPKLDFFNVDITSQGSVIEEGVVAEGESHSETTIRTFKEQNENDIEAEADIIISVEGDEIDTTNDLYYKIAKHSSNDDNKVTVRVQRGDVESLGSLKVRSFNGD